MAKAQQLKIRLFLEGIEVPVIAAQTVSMPNSPTQCVIQVPPSAMGTKLLPRTLVHVFFLDLYEGESPLVSNTVQTTQKKDPTAYEQSAARLNSTDEEDQIGVEELLRDRFNNRYKLLFTGELIGYQWTKNQSSRSLVLQCVDLSNYWDYAYQFNNTDIFGPGFKAMFSGGSTDLLTDFLSSPGEVITSLLHQSSVQYPSLPGLLGGIVRIIESIGGSYYYGKTFQGQNTFFSLAELRLHISQMVTVFPTDPTASRLLNSDGWEPLFGRLLGGLGEQVSIRDVMNSLMSTVFHETFAQTCPKYVPGSGGSVSGFGRKKIRNVPGLFQFYQTAVNGRQQIAIIKGSIISTEPLPTSPGQESTALAKKPVDVLVIQLDRLRKTLNEASTFSNRANLPAASPLFSTAATAIGTAITRLRKDWAPGRGGKKIDDIINKLDEAVTNLTKVENLEVNTVAQSKAIPARLNSHIIRPDIWFGPPPRCNVLFPENYDTLNYSRVFMQEPTRLLLKTNEEFIGEDELFDSFYFAPKTRTVKGQERTLSALFNNDVFDHELFTGILPVFEKMGELNILAVRSGTVDTTLPKVSLAQRSTNFLYFKYRFAARKMSVRGKFNPYVVSGFPGLVIDKYVDLDQVATIRSLLEQNKRKVPELRKYLGTHYLGSFTQVNHSIDQRSGSTTIECSYPREHDETSEFLGTAMQDDQVVQKRTGADAERSTTIATITKPPLGGIGPNFGVITKVESPGGLPGQGDATTATTYPLFLGAGTQGGGANVPVDVPVIAGDYGTAVADAVGDPSRIVTFKAYRVTERVPRYRQDVVQLPPEEYIRPGWYADVWHPTKIGTIYDYYFSTGSIVDQLSVRRSDGSATGQTSADTADALTEAGKSTGKSDPRSDIAAVLTLDTGSSIEQAVDFLVLTYSYMKQSGLDPDEFIRSYTWRPIATMLDMFGTSDLEFTEDGASVAKGIEGFHSRAFGNYNDLFGLTTPDIESILGVTRQSLARQRLDVRGRRFQAVADFVSSLQLSRALIG